MQLIADDYNQVYVWVDVNDHDLQLSPCFDYEEDAISWATKIRQLLVD